MLLQPRNWAKFQHYKDRCPPWIKLHRDLLNDREFMCLPIASKALAPLLWLLASESKDGSFDASVDELVFRLRVSHSEVQQGLKPLIDKGFFVVASGVLAECLQVAIPETEREEETEAKKETEAETNLSEPVFIQMPLTGSKSHPVAASRLPYYRELYPAVDVEAELRKMVGWLNANPSRRKTARGIEAFINSWLSRAQDSGPRLQVSGIGINKQEALEARNRAVAQRWVEKMQQQMEANGEAE
jgi:hypothetical protein